ncbi:hypothetical protein BaRGS_00029806, partial [Batillaria attramentaria]
MLRRSPADPKLCGGSRHATGSLGGRVSDAGIISNGVHHSGKWSLCGLNKVIGRTIFPFCSDIT